MAVCIDDRSHGLGRDAVELGFDLPSGIHPFGGIDDEDSVVPFDEDHVRQSEAHRHVHALSDADHLSPEFLGVREQFVSGSELLRHPCRRDDRRERGDQHPG